MPGAGMSARIPGYFPDQGHQAQELLKGLRARVLPQALADYVDCLVQAFEEKTILSKDFGS